MWKDQRRFLHEKLRNFGMTNSGTGKKIMEARIMVSLPVFQFEFRGFDRPNRRFYLIDSSAAARNFRYRICTSRILSVAISARLLIIAMS